MNGSYVLLLRMGLGILATACTSAGQPIDGPVSEDGTTTGNQSTGQSSTDEGTGSDDDGVTSTSEGSDSADGSTSTDGGALPDPEGPVGWASVDAEGQVGTNGGAGGPTIVVETIEELAEAVAEPGPRVVQVSGTLSGIVTVTTSDKTIEGLPGARIDGGVVVEGSADAQIHNIIVRNLRIVGAACAGGCSSDDTVTIRWAHHVWIDHCDLLDGDDGNLDITKEADYITVSWTRFSYSDVRQPERLSNLIGAGDDEVEDADDLRVTIHHCWWADGVDGYMPRARFGQIHVFDNYYSAIGNDHCIRVGVQANLRVENNYFDGVTWPFDIPIDPSALVVARSNLAVPVLLEDFDQGEAFVPPYPYALDAAAVVPALVMAGAGPP